MIDISKIDIFMSTMAITEPACQKHKHCFSSQVERLKAALAARDNQLEQVFFLNKAKGDSVELEKIKFVNLVNTKLPQLGRRLGLAEVEKVQLVS